MPNINVSESIYLKLKKSYTKQNKVIFPTLKNFTENLLLYSIKRNGIPDEKVG